MTNLKESNTVATNPTNIKVELHFTRNLGNYESLRVGIGIEDHVRQGETIDNATNRVYAFVEEKLMEKVNEIEDELKKGKAKK